jgi:hypothetical protein
MEEGQSQQSSMTTLDLESVLSVGISNGIAVAGVRVSGNSRYTALMFENHDTSLGNKASSSWNQTIGFHNDKNRPGLIDIDGDVVAVSYQFDVNVVETASVNIYQRVNSSTLMEEAQIMDVTWESYRPFGVSAKGDLVAVGIPYYGGHSGAVFVHRFDTLSKSWNQFYDPITNDECAIFGSSVVLLKDEGLLIGCTEKGRDSAAVYFYSQQQSSEGYTFQQIEYAIFGSLMVLFKDEGLTIGCTEKRSASGAVNFYSQHQISEGYTFQQNILTSGKIKHNIIQIYAKENMTWAEVDKVPAPGKDSKFLSVAISGRKALVSSESNVYAYFLQDC